MKGGREYNFLHNKSMRYQDQSEEEVIFPDSYL